MTGCLRLKWHSQPRRCKRVDGQCNTTPRPSQLTPRKDTKPFVQEAGWASGRVWTCKKNLAPTGIRSPDRPGRSESLYRLRQSVRFWRIHQTIPRHIHWNILTTKAVTYFTYQSAPNRGNVRQRGCFSPDYRLGSATPESLLRIWKRKRLKRSCPRKRWKTSFWTAIGGTEFTGINVKLVH
jgi:hypothetical protein